MNTHYRRRHRRLRERRKNKKRQQVAVEKFACSNGYRVVETYYDEAVSGADPIDMRPGFKRMLDLLLGNGIRTILVETASRFARDLIVQETGHALLKEPRPSRVDLIPRQPKRDDRPSLLGRSRAG